MKGDPPSACQELGSVKGESGWFQYTDLSVKAKASMRNNAAKIGANYVRLETAVGEGVVTGTAYQCPESDVGMPASGQ
jgi:hypothetical protein